MARQVKEFVKLGNLESLDELIARLIGIRDSLPPCAEARIRMRGDEVFGRHLSISYLRDQTAAQR